MPKRSMRAPHAGKAVPLEKSSVAQQDSVPPDAHRTRVLTSAMPTLEDLTVLHNLDAHELLLSSDGARNKLISDAIGMMKIPVGEATLKTILATLRSVEAAKVAAEAAIDSITPQLASAVQATENAWRRIEYEYGMLTSKQVAVELGSTNKNPSEYAASQRKQGKLIGIQRRNAILHPGFQLSNGEIRPAISRLINTATKLDLPLDELTQWLCAPNEAFGDEKPVNYLDDPDDLLEALHNDFDAQW